VLGELERERVAGVRRLVLVRARLRFGASLGLGELAA